MPESKSAAALRKALEEHKASELDGISNRNAGSVIELDSSMKPIDAANVLWDNNILGAPVWSKDIAKYVGYVDMRDMLSVVIAATKKSESTNIESYNVAMVNELDALGEENTSTTLTYLAARNPFVFCTPDTTLAKVGKELVEKRCHRIPIAEAEGMKATNVISQSALVKFLSKTVKKEELEETLADAGFEYSREVLSIVETASAFEAFELMDSHRRSGLAVVDEDGILVGNTSARDIKLAASNRGEQSMNVDIMDYLAAVRQSSLVERYPISHVYEDATVAHVVNLMAKTGYHRVFVVDKEKKPVGVISVHDIVKFAIGEKKLTKQKSDGDSESEVKA